MGCLRCALIFERGDRCVVAAGGGGGGDDFGGWRGGGGSGCCGDTGVQLVLECRIFALKGVEELHCLFVVLFSCTGGGHGQCALVGTRPCESNFERRAVGSDGIEEMLCFCPPLEIGSVLPAKELAFCEDVVFVHIVNIHDDFE